MGDEGLFFLAENSKEGAAAEGRPAGAGQGSPFPAFPGPRQPPAASLLKTPDILSMNPKKSRCFKRVAFFVILKVKQECRQPGSPPG